MFKQEIQDAKARQLNADSKRRFNHRLNEILSGQHTYLPSANEVDAVKNISNDVEDTRKVTLNEFRRFLNIATQVAQGTKSIRQTERVKSNGNKVNAILSNISTDETPQSVFKKMSNAIVLLSQMITDTAEVSKTSTLSSVANSVLTRDLSKKLQRR